MIRLEPRICTSPQALETLGARIAGLAEPPLTIFLYGELGAGKTTLARGFILANGFSGPVKSPTFTLVEPYLHDDCTIYHFDFYRINDPDELELAGVRDYFNMASYRLIEWPERAGGRYGQADLHIHLAVISAGRRVEISAHSGRGEVILDQLAHQSSADDSD